MNLLTQNIARLQLNSSKASYFGHKVDSKIEIMEPCGYFFLAG